MPATKRERERRAIERASALELRAEQELPAGVCGRVQGIALVYGVVDSYGTRFKKGCLDRTRSEKVATGKVKLFIAEDEHYHQYGTKTHIGTVRALEDVGDTVLMTADLFDTEGGRRAKEYLTAVTTTKSETGLSVGVYVREDEMVEENGRMIYEFTECELAEITVTTFPAVPGAGVTAVRSRDAERAQLRRAIEIMQTTLASLDASANGQHPKDGSDAAAEDRTSTANGRSPAAGKSDAPDGTDSQPRNATMEERAAAVRSSYTRSR